jgi:hypothetical protein
MAMQFHSFGVVFRELLISRDAKAMRYLTSGRAQAHPCVARYSTPVSYGPEVRYRTPSALCECMGQWFLIDGRRLTLNLWVYALFEYLVY